MRVVCHPQAALTALLLLLLFICDHSRWLGGGIAAVDAWTDTEYPLDEYGRPASHEQQQSRQRIRACYSCMSKSFLLIWPKLLHHYYPPKNFTDECQHPTENIGMVPCESACFTIVEDVHRGGVIVDNRYMRGCIDRLLLFGIESDLREAVSRIDPGERQMCRATHRKLLSLVNTEDLSPVSAYDRQRANEYEEHSAMRSISGRQHRVVTAHAWQHDIVVICSCMSDRCNNMQITAANSANHLNNIIITYYAASLLLLFIA